jgi:integrase
VTTIRGHIRKYLVPYFGRQALKDIEPELVQRSLSSLKLSSKTVRNIFVTIQIMWKSARAWKYVTHDITEDVILPQRAKVHRRHFTVEEIRRILVAADEPYQTFYWLAVETGMRAGELCGLVVGDVDFDRGRIRVRQSVWHEKMGEPKTENAIRSFALSARLVERLEKHVAGLRSEDLLFRTRNATPWDANLLVTRKLRPLLRSLEIPEAGLYAFRHSNASMMDTLAVPMKVRQQRLGHSDIKLTMNVYTHVASEDDARTAEEIAGVLWPNVAKSKKEGLPEIPEALVSQ